ncbi:MAG: class I poly(R)-hydroxyalkanoic acid synthase [Chloroflexi bacterium]|nr:class I poly(R)-hydroxyalkanoic acid synthase [Chloroflexota bacterium]
MPDEQTKPIQLSDVYKLWVTNPLTQSWITWQKVLWASSPLSRLVPLDAEELWRAFEQLGEDLTARPELLEERTAELLRRYNELSVWTLSRALGQPDPEPVATDKQDKRFQDEAWTNNLIFNTLKQSYLILSNWLVGTANQADGLDPQTRQRVKFYVRQFVDAISPSNFLLTNPAALHETLNSGGENLRRGLEQMLDDMKQGEVSVSGKEHFQIGQNLAISPGQVIFRNELVELIQYSPATEQVYQIPILIIPPWINKFYILDLRPGRSLVEYLVQQGHTVFMISWRNPKPAMQNLVMEDYVRLGPLAAMQVIKAVTGSEKINLLGHCIGGTLVSVLLAYQSAVQDATANTATFLTSLQDFSDVGETAVFVSREWLAEIEKWVHPKGYIDGVEMNAIFKLMRDNDLIWNFVVNNYLLGKTPLDFDLLYWSSDGIRMPRAFHSEYLRNCYIENNLVKPNRIRMFGQGIDLSCIQTPSYVVAGIEDHIVPWRSAHRTRALFSGSTRLILGSGGHIGTTVNPPSAIKGFYYSNDSDTTDSDQWLKTAQRNPGSWWPDWNKWLDTQSGAKVAPPSLGGTAYPPLANAPGTYVVEA